MSLSTICTALSATPFASALLSLTIEVLPLIRQVGQCIRTFQTGSITPVTSQGFESELLRLLHEIGRVIVEWVFNRCEPEDPHQAVPEVSFDQNIYRRRDRSPRR